MSTCNLGINKKQKIGNSVSTTAKEYPKIKISYSLGSGHAFPVHIREFIIAAYRETVETRDISIQQRLSDIAPPRYVRSTETTLIDYKCVAEIPNDKTNSLYWVKQMVRLDSRGIGWTNTGVSALKYKSTIHRLQSLIPYLAKTLDDLKNTPYIFNMNGDIGDERTLEVVHYLTKALRYNARIIL